MNSAFVGFAVATCLSLFPGNTFATNPPLDQPSSVKQGRVDGSGDLLEQYGGSIPSDVTAVFGEGGILSLMWLLAELWFLRVGWAKRWRPRAPRRDMYGLRLGWCQALAATVCARAGASGASLRMAYEAWLKLGVSKSKAGIPVGARVIRGVGQALMGTMSSACGGTTSATVASTLATVRLRAFVMVQCGLKI